MNYNNHKLTVVVNGNALRLVTKNIDGVVMAAYGVSFESANSIDEKKENKRQARQETLEKVRTVSFVNNSSIYKPRFVSLSSVTV